MDFTAAIAPFAPFYTDTVGVEGQRAGKQLRGQFRACVFDQGLGDPLNDADASTSRRCVTIQIPVDGPGAWIGGRPQVGDKVTVESYGCTFKVSTVSRPLGCAWELEARQA